MNTEKTPLVVKNSKKTLFFIRGIESTLVVIIIMLNIAVTLGFSIYGINDIAVDAFLLLSFTIDVTLNISNLALIYEFLFNEHYSVYRILDIYMYKNLDHMSAIESLMISLGMLFICNVAYQLSGSMFIYYLTGQLLTTPLTWFLGLILIVLLALSVALLTIAGYLLYKIAKDIYGCIKDCKDEEYSERAIAA